MVNKAVFARLVFAKTFAFPSVSVRFVVLPELPPAVSLTRVMVASRRYRPAWESGDVGRAVRMTVPGTLFEYPSVAAPSPVTFAFDPNAVLVYPALKVELSVSIAGKFVWLRHGGL